MDEIQQTVSPPPIVAETRPALTRPLFVYDGDCGFCRAWVTRWQSLTGDSLEFVPYQEAAASYPDLAESFKHAVHLIEPDGEVSAGAKAVFKSLRQVPDRGWMYWAYRRVPGFAPVSEAVYRAVSANRPSLAWSMKVLWGKGSQRSTYYLSRWLFLRLMAVIYFIAFGSLWLQWPGLIGSKGILPAADFVSAIERYLGPERYWRLPTMLWWGSSDAVLNGLCVAGMALSVGLFFGLASRLLLFALWAIYLSLVNIGQDFLSFQWDALLLEAGFLTIFYAPGTLVPSPRSAKEPSPAFRWLLWWLLARLMFLSGATKLTYGDPTWHDLSALRHHYETQPLPTWLGWYAHQLPAWFQATSVVIMYGIEIFLPFLIFLPRHCRQFAAAGTILLMLLIGATGNYTFFNLLTIALCITLLDDVLLEKFVLRRLLKMFPVPGPPQQRALWPRLLLAPLVIVILAASTIEAWDEVWGLKRSRREESGWISSGLSYLRPFRSINGYGLFRVMTTSRPEIIIEGSDDAVTWKAYEFKWKPGDVYRRPAFVEPHQPRLDWQMWFAALSAPHRPAWFDRFILRLMQGQPEVLALLANNPFPDHPPRYFRAELYDYHFTTAAQRAENGAWWRREQTGTYLPVVSNRAAKD